MLGNNKPDELNLANKENVKEQKYSENDEYVLSEWQAPKNKTGFFIFLFSTAFFLPFGIVFLVLNDQITEISYRYDQTCFSSQQTIFSPSICPVNISVPADMSPPIYFYYELNNYFQNHRVYLESRDDEQLQGKYKTVDELASCNPIITNDKVSPNLVNLSGYPLEPSDPATPCGLIAQTFFNDTYQLFKLNDNGTKTSIFIDETDISWKYDRDTFKNTDHIEKQWMNMSNEHFQVWMRAAGLSKFKKLWGRIQTTLPQGDYQVVINNNYDVTQYDAKKYFVITTVNALGGKNTVLVYSYMITAGICFFLTILFLIAWIREKKYKKN